MLRHASLRERERLREIERVYERESVSERERRGERGTEGQKVRVMCQASSVHTLYLDDLHTCMYMYTPCVTMQDTV